MIILIIFIAFMLFLGLTGYCYFYAFKADSKRLPDAFDVPKTPYREAAIENINKLMESPFEWVEVTSKDNLKLKGRYYHNKDKAPLAIIFHGYRSNYCRDGSGGFQIAKEYGLNVLMPDQRAHGKSEGKTISFGIKERYDCAVWVDYAKKRFGNHVEIILIGLSMGAATVMMAADIVPKENVKGIIADCGFSSPKDILLEVAGQMKLPKRPAYFFVRLAAKIFGGFNTEETSAVDALKNTEIPLLFIHGEADAYVPCRMSHICHEACASKKQIFTVPDAGHGLSFYYNTKGYYKAVNEFLDKILK